MPRATPHPAVLASRMQTVPGRRSSWPCPRPSRGRGGEDRR